MGIESVTGIWDLNSAWPLGTDDRSTLDNHDRLIKDALSKTFINVSGTILASHTEINYLQSAAENVQEAIDRLSATLANAINAIAALEGTVSGIDVAALQASIDVVSAAAVSVDARVTSVGAGVTSVDARVTSASSAFATNINALSASLADKYSFRITNTATGVGWPSGWALAQQGSGNYRVTHSLGTNNYIPFAIHIGASNKNAIISLDSANGFDVFVFDADAGTAITATGIGVFVNAI